MGKRELFIALAFVAAAAVAYQMTAPAPKPGEQGFSFSRIWNEARREMRGNQANATAKSTGSFPASAELSDLRFESVRVGALRLRLVGEARADVAYELSVQSNGPDEATALDYAKRVRLTTDDLGRSLTMRMDYPAEYRQSATMVVRLPSRMGVVVSGAGAIEVSDVATAQLDGMGGECAVSRVAGLLSGSHRNGRLKVDGAGSVKLDVRNGQCSIANVKGRIDLDEQRDEITIANPAGPVWIGGSEGRIVLTNPRAESRIDVRRAEVEVQLSAAIPLTLLTTEDTLRLMLEGPPHVVLDAVATSARIQASDFDLPVDTNEKENRLMHTFGAAGAPRISLRNTRGDIVIRKSGAPIVNRERK